RLVAAVALLGAAFAHRGGPAPPEPLAHRPLVVAATAVAPVATVPPAGEAAAPVGAVAVALGEGGGARDVGVAVAAKVRRAPGEDAVLPLYAVQHRDTLWDIA